MECFKKYLVEFIGAFFLVFTIGATAAFGGPGVIAPLAIGFALMVMVYAGGYISGGHYNPAVSLAAVVRGALPAKEWLPYAVFQILGGVAAAFVVNLLGAAPACPAVPYDICGVIVGEVLFTFALCYVVLLTATSSKTAGNSYYGLAIGSTVMVGAFAVGGICMGAFNPAVAISALVLGSCCCWKFVCLTVIMNLVAGALAGVVYKFLNED
ncbi:aquaporin [bacterium]|nr:aquaporin [bacterium]